MKKNILVLCMLSVLVTVSSCKKFLEEQSQTDIVPRSASALNELLLGAGYLNSGIDGPIYFMDDDVSQTGFFVKNGPTYYAYTWQPEHIAQYGGAGSKQWALLYPQILTCNLVLDYAPKVSGTLSEIENVTGQAYMFRAFNYFQLVNFYAKPYLDKLSDPNLDLGVPLILNSGLSFEGQPRNTVAEVYQQIVFDLDKGIELTERSGKSNSVYRMSPIAGYLLSSRVHLQLGNWQKAIEAATNVLIRKSDLMDLTVWGGVNQNSKPVVSPENPESLWVFGSGQNFVYDGDKETSYYALSNELLSTFETGDLRFTAYIKDKKSIKRPSGVSFVKVGSAFRVSEALLNRAEAYAQLNKLGQTSNAQLALNDLNTLRKKRFIAASYRDLSVSDADDLLQKCYDEKRREFFNEENHRWFDLRRHGMPEITHRYYENNVQTANYVLQDHDAGYVLQIPKTALDKNSKLIPNPNPPVRIGN